MRQRGRRKVQSPHLKLDPKKVRTLNTLPLTPATTIYKRLGDDLYFTLLELPVTKCNETHRALYLPTLLTHFRVPDSVEGSRR